MKHRLRRPLPFVVLLCLPLCLGCAANYSAVVNIRPQPPAGGQRPLRAAVVRFQDHRTGENRKSEQTGWVLAVLVWLWPYSNINEPMLDKLPETHAGAGQQGVVVEDFPTQAAKSLMLHLSRSRYFDQVRFVTDVGQVRPGTDDIIIEGVLHEARWHGWFSQFGLGPYPGVVPFFYAVSYFKLRWDADLEVTARFVDQRRPLFRGRCKVTSRTVSGNMYNMGAHFDVLGEAFNELYRGFLKNLDQKLAAASDTAYWSRRQNELLAHARPQHVPAYPPRVPPPAVVRPPAPRPVRPDPVPAASGVQNRWAVVVGISEYRHAGKHGLTNLSFADDDARGMRASLLKLGWDADHIRCLTNKQATKAAIEDALEGWLTKAGKNDLIVLYWSGHGYPDPANTRNVYFACHDTDASRAYTGWRMDRVLNAIRERKARNVVVIADTCHAGRLVTRGSEKDLSIRPYVEQLRQRKSVPSGWIYMVAAETDRKAIENTSLSNGAFTHCLLKGLGGAADANGDTRVNMLELKAYMSTTMPEITRKLLSVAKHPVILTNSADTRIWELELKGK